MIDVVSWDEGMGLFELMCNGVINLDFNLGLNQSLFCFKIFNLATRLVPHVVT
jgi:hypothetical protein